MAVAAALLSSCGSQAASDVSIDLNLPDKLTVDDAIFSKQWDPVVTNDSGKKIDDAVLTVHIQAPGDGRIPIVASDSYPFNDCNEEEPCPPHPEEGRECEYANDVEGREPRCPYDLKPGKTKFYFELGLPFDASIHEGVIRDYPDLRISAEVKDGDEIVATAEDSLAVAFTSKLKRVTIDGVPAVVPSDRDEADSFEWSFTATNNSGKDLDDATISVWTSPFKYDVGLATTHEGCRYNGDSGSRTVIECAADIPAGVSVTIEMRMFADGDLDTLKANCRKSDDGCVESGQLNVRVEAPGIYPFATGKALTKAKLVK